MDLQTANLVSRLLVRFQSECGRELLTAFSDDPARGDVMSLLRRLAGPLGGKSARATSIGALARSLGRPFETVRRQVHALHHDGLVEVSDEGVRMALEAADEGPAAVMYAAVAQHFIRLLHDFAVAGVLVPASFAPAAVSHEDALLAGLDLCLCALERNEPQFASWTEMAVVGRALVLNVARVGSDPVLNRRFGAQGALVPPPLRQPVSAGRIATELGLPRQTVWPHLAAAAERGIVVRQGRGYLVSPAWLASDAVVANAEQILRYAARVIGSLVRTYTPAAAAHPS